MTAPSTSPSATISPDRGCTPPTPGPDSLRDFLAAVRQDHKINSEGLWTPGFYAAATQRWGAWIASDGFPAALRPAMAAAQRLAGILMRNVAGIEIPNSVQLGRGVRIAHQHGIVIHPGAQIGDGTVIRQNVTLGAGSGDPATFHAQAPRVGHGVSLGAGCVLVGRVIVGDGATIGPNAVVMTHVPPGATVLAPPPRVIPARAQPEDAA